MLGDGDRVTNAGRGSVTVPLPAHHIECLLMAVLAVNNYTLQKAWNLLPLMREAGITDPARVAGGFDASNGVAKEPTNPGARKWPPTCVA